MNVNIYSIYDSQLQSYAAPFFSPTNGSALRAFADHVNERGTAANKHPEDFTLWHLGSFNDQEGSISPTKPNRIGTAAEYYKDNNP